MTYTHIACTNSEGRRVIQPFAPLQLSFVERSDGAAAAVYYIAGEAVQADVREKFSDILEMMVSVGVAIDCTQERKWDVGKAQVEQTPNPNYGGGALAAGRFPVKEYGSPIFKVTSGPDADAADKAFGYAGEIDRNTPAKLIENLKKQLAAKDDEIAELNKDYRSFHNASILAYQECAKFNRQPATPCEAVKILSDAAWTNQTEIHRLNAQLGQKSKQIERLQGTIAEYQAITPEQPAPPAHALSDESQGIKGDGVTGD